MKLAAMCFVGLAVLVLVVLIAVLAFNPSRHDPAFVVQTFVILGILGIWSTIAAWLIRTRKSAGAAYALVGLLTMLIAIGWLQYGSLQLDEPIHPVLNALRIASGLYVMSLWPVLIRASILTARQQH
jgi:hypothetical protein